MADIDKVGRGMCIQRVTGLYAHPGVHPTGGVSMIQ